MTRAKESQRRKGGMTGRIEARRGRESHARGAGGAMGQGEGGWGVSKLSGAGEGRGLSDLEQKTPFRFLTNLDA